MTTVVLVDSTDEHDMCGNAPDKSKNMFDRGRVKCCTSRVS